MTAEYKTSDFSILVTFDECVRLANTAGAVAEHPHEVYMVTIGRAYKLIQELLAVKQNQNVKGYKKALSIVEKDMLSYLNEKKVMIESTYKQQRRLKRGTLELRKKLFVLDTLISLTESYHMMIVALIKKSSGGKVDPKDVLPTNNASNNFCGIEVSEERATKWRNIFKGADPELQLLALSGLSSRLFKTAETLKLTLMGVKNVDTLLERAHVIDGFSEVFKLQLEDLAAASNAMTEIHK